MFKRSFPPLNGDLRWGGYWKWYWFVCTLLNVVVGQTEQRCFERVSKSGNSSSGVRITRNNLYILCFALVPLKLTFPYKTQLHQNRESKSHFWLFGNDFLNIIIAPLSQKTIFPVLFITSEDMGNQFEANLLFVAAPCWDVQLWLDSFIRSGRRLTALQDIHLRYLGSLAPLRLCVRLQHSTGGENVTPLTFDLRSVEMVSACDRRCG